MSVIQPGRARMDPDDKATIRVYISPKADRLLTQAQEETHQTRGEIILDLLQGREKPFTFEDLEEFEYQDCLRREKEKEEEEEEEESWPPGEEDADDGFPF